MTEPDEEQIRKVAECMLVVVLLFAINIAILALLDPAIGNMHRRYLTFAWME